MKKTILQWVFMTPLPLLLLFTAHACSSGESCLTGNLKGCMCPAGSAGLQRCEGGSWSECTCSELDLSEDRDVGADPIHDPGEDVRDGRDGLDGAEDIHGDREELDAPAEWDLPEAPELPTELMEPCVVTVNKLHMVGDTGDSPDYIHPGPFTAEGTADWNWTPQLYDSSISGYIDVVEVNLESPTLGEGPWTVDFSSKELSEALSTGMYDDAMRYPFESPGQPGLKISGEGRECTALTGWFYIFDLAIDDSGVTSVLTRLSASFEQHCEGGTPALQGCIHYEQ
jgi:hypothetical protein